MSGAWPYVRDAICSIQPARVVLENVRGHLSLGFDVVLADLARMGWSARWGVVRASDAGAPHDRPRLFVIANPDGATRTQQVKWSQAYDATSRRNDAPGRCVHASHWGEYREAVCRWTCGRQGSARANAGNGISSTRITPAFVEWMMGLPEGWVTGHGLTASQELKMLGNGVVPRRCARPTPAGRCRVSQHQASRLRQPTHRRQLPARQRVSLRRSPSALGATAAVKECLLTLRKARRGFNPPPLP